MFKGRKLVIATKHHKERVIAPLIENALGVSCFVNSDFDTDRFGTFSGEIDRKNDPLTTARDKCLEAMTLSRCDLGIASEGSFGAHPTIPLITANEEIIILIDRLHHLEIVAKTLSTATNFNAQTVTNEKSLIEFAERVKFPDHALILRPSKGSTNDLIKGITDLNTLTDSFRSLLKTYGQVYIETDMRAMYNPLRMSVIEETTKKLIEKINTCCPNCQAPGFDVVNINSGLPCDWCGSPTRSTLSVIYECHACGCKEDKKFPHGKTSEDPMYCDLCNP